ETLQLAQERRDKMKKMNKEIKPANYTKINHLSGVFVPQKALSHEESYFSNNSKITNVSKSFSIPNEDLSDDTSLSVARKFLNEVKSTIVTLQHVVKQRMTIETHNWASSAHQELYNIVKDENFPIVNQVETRLQNFKIQFLKEAAKFVEDFKSLANEADTSLTKQKALELEIERLLKAVISQNIMIIVQNESVVDTSDLQTKLERTKERFENCIIKKESEYAKLWNDNDHVAAILGFGDLQWGNILITRVYFIEGLGHNLFSVGQFCDSDLEVAFRRNACFVRNLEGVDLLKGDRSTNLYTINLHELASASPICLMARASPTKSWLWYQRLSHLNFDTINDLARNDLVAFSEGKATSDGLFKGIQIQGSMAISHLFYADEAVFLGEWSDSNMDNIVKILKCFFLGSGLKINIQKSQVLGVGVPRNIINQAASLIGCAVMQNPFRYLGVMVGDNMSRKLAWADTAQKLRSRLSKWKVKTLSIGGRLTLLKSVLGASPLYNMSINKVPKGVLKEMEAIRCNFFNGADHAERKITWVSWDKVLPSKKNGGLGVSSFYALNRALLLKWSLVWCSILREMHVLISKGFDFVSHGKKRVGDGHNTRFWYDSWVFDQPLRVRLPRLFALETDKESTWDDLNSVLGSVTLSASKDKWICDLNGDGVFRVKEVCTILDDVFFPSAADATRWVKYILIKINVFAWRARLDRLPTRSNLVRRGVVLDSSLCSMCGLVPEDIHHVLFRCDTAKLVFRRICRWWDLDWHDLLSFSDWNAWFSAIRLPSMIKLVLEGVFYVAWWHLWVYRNQSIFAATPPRRSVIFDDIVLRFFTCEA
nr:RNA-directed DNA polymerase, eukaryota [Tanacetum cinerariifolium]